MYALFIYSCNIDLFQKIGNGKFEEEVARIVGSVLLVKSSHTKQ